MPRGGENPSTIVSEWWGTDLNVQAIDAIAAAPREQHLEFAHFYRTMVKRTPRPHGPRKSVATCGLNSRPDRLYGPTTLPLGSSRVRGLALFVDHVVTDDPVDVVMRDLLIAEDSDHYEPPSRRDLRDALTTVADLAPLIHAGVVEMRPQESPDWSEDDLDALKSLILLFHELPRDQLDWRWIAADQSRNRDAGGLAALHLFFDLGRARLREPTGAYFVGTPLEHSVLALLASTAGEVLTDQQVDLFRLATLPVPILIPKSSAIVDVRDADEYAVFRSDLGKALTEVDSITVTDESWLIEARSLVHSELEIGRRRLEAKLRSGGLGDLTRSAGSGLTLSALGTAVAAQVGGKPVPSLASGAIAAIGTALGRFLSERPQVRQRRSVLESYLMFDLSKGTPPHSES